MNFAGEDLGNHQWEAPSIAVKFLCLLVGFPAVFNGPAGRLWLWSSLVNFAKGVSGRTLVFGISELICFFGRVESSVMR